MVQIKIQTCLGLLLTGNSLCWREKARHGKTISFSFEIIGKTVIALIYLESRMFIFIWWRWLKFNRNVSLLHRKIIIVTNLFHRYKWWHFSSYLVYYTSRSYSPYYLCTIHSFSYLHYFTIITVSPVPCVFHV